MSLVANFIQESGPEFGFDIKEEEKKLEEINYFF